MQGQVHWDTKECYEGKMIESTSLSKSSQNIMYWLAESIPLAEDDKKGGETCHPKITLHLHFLRPNINTAWQANDMTSL